MWKRSKEQSSSQEGELSPKSSRLKSLLRPFSRKSHQDSEVTRAVSDYQLSLEKKKSEARLRLSKSGLERRLSMEETRAPQVEVREVRRLGAAPEVEEVATSKQEIATSKREVAAAGQKEVTTSRDASEEAIMELTSAFKYFDHNSDGCIDKQELGSVMRALGECPTDEELEAMIGAVDQNGDGFICLDEFLNLNRMALQVSDFDGELREAFNVFDLDRNGFISSEELQQVLSNLLGEQVVKSECDRMIKGVDQDGDGQVNIEEFCTMMRQGMPC